MGALLREANTRDVWQFATPDEIRDLWPDLIPHLGRIRLGELTGRQVADTFHTLGSTNNGWGRPPTPATLHRIRATLRGAINAAIREGLPRDNPRRSNPAASVPG